MRLRIFTEPQQGASYATLRRVARATEDLGHLADIATQVLPQL